MRRCTEVADAHDREVSWDDAVERLRRVYGALRNNVVARDNRRRPVFARKPFLDDLLGVSDVVMTFRVPRRIRGEARAGERPARTVTPSSGAVVVGGFTEKQGDIAMAEIDQIARDDPAGLLVVDADARTGGIRVIIPKGEQGNAAFRQRRERVVGRDRNQ